MDEQAKTILDMSALGITAGSFFQILPSITALASLVWILIRIYETDTIQKLLGR